MATKLRYLVLVLNALSVVVSGALVAIACAPLYHKELIYEEVLHWRPLGAIIVSVGSLAASLLGCCSARCPMTFMLHMSADVHKICMCANMAYAISIGFGIDVLPPVIYKNGVNIRRLWVTMEATIECCGLNVASNQNMFRALMVSVCRCPLNGGDCNLESTTNACPMDLDSKMEEIVHWWMLLTLGLAVLQWFDSMALGMLLSRVRHIQHIESLPWIRFGRNNGSRELAMNHKHANLSTAVIDMAGSTDRLV